MQSTMRHQNLFSHSLRGLRARVVVALAFASVLTVACDVHGVVGPGTAQSLTVSPNATLLPNGTQQMVAQALDADGRAVTVTPVWSVVGGGGTINASGLFTAGALAGSFANTVKATVGTLSANASITVTPGAIASIVVTPNPVTLAVTATQQFTAVAKDAGGNVVAFVPSWSVIADGGTIDQNGLFTAGRVARTFTNTVQASSLGVRGFATVTVTAGALASLTVTPNPDTLVIAATQQFTATGKDAYGNLVSTAPTWTMAQGGGLISTTGLFTAGQIVGTFTNTVKATSGTISGTATVVVSSGRLATITVTPTPVSLVVQGFQQYVAVGRDSSGNVVPLAPTWSVVQGGGTIDSTGLFTAGTVIGTYTNTIQASRGGIKGFATVTVVPGLLATITVTPNPVTLSVNTAQTFTAVGKDVFGNTVVITPVWSVVSGGGSINASGLFTAGSTAGTYTNTIQASQGTLKGFATVTVLPGALATITVTPNPDTLVIGATQQFVATGRDGSGNTVAITPAWSVTAGGGTISTTGLFTAGTLPGTYTNTVVASVGAITGRATVVVNPGPVATIIVSPNPATVLGLTTQQFTAVGKDASNNTVTFTPTWSVVNGGGSIDANSGLFTAFAPTGTFTNTVQAASGLIKGFATVTVTAAAPDYLGITAPNGIMAGLSVTCSSASTISADVAISPGNTITGFPPCVITGTQHLGDATAALQQTQLTTTYNTLMGLPCLPSNVISADLGGTTKAAGVWCSASGIGVTGTVTLNGGGDPNAVFVFQAGSSLTTAGNVALIGQAQAKNVYWVVGSSATLGTASQWQGNVVALTSISLIDSATLNGRALARNGTVSLTTGNNITLP